MNLMLIEQTKLMGTYLSCLSMFVQVADVTFWSDIEAKAKFSDDDESEPLHSKPGPTLEDNVYSLGILLLEIISSKSLSVQERSLDNFRLSCENSITCCTIMSLLLL